jgi:hypothetical protein
MYIYFLRRNNFSIIDQEPYSLPLPADRYAVIRRLSEGCSPLIQSRSAQQQQPSLPSSTDQSPCEIKVEYSIKSVLYVSVTTVQFFTYRSGFLTSVFAAILVKSILELSLDKIRPANRISIPHSPIVNKCTL